MSPTAYDTPLADATFVVFDFETTGLDVSRGARVVEIGALRLERGEVAGHCLTLVDPGVPVPSDATRIHGLTDADLAGQPTLADAFPPFLAFAGDAVLVAHNLPFDMSFVVAASLELGLPPLRNATVDLLGLSRYCCPGLPSYSLENLAATFGVVNPAPHRSLGDVAVESQLLLTYLESLREKGAAGTVADLVMLSRGAAAGGAIAPATVALEWAAAAGRQVPIVYRGTRGESTRSISPRRVKIKGRYCYVVAYCHSSGAEREFRLDRLELAPEQ
jgi:DNA polymerase III epsilon subunit family exonuclease